jgi:TonB-linked SusC/RagA family outer membrane protein
MEGQGMIGQWLARQIPRLMAACIAASLPLTAHAQAGQITGTVVREGTLDRLATVQVYLEGTTIGALTRADGVFTLANVPPGTYTVIAQRIGFREARESNVTVTLGQTTTVTLTMSEQVLALQGVVATGLVDPVEGVRSPISVARVDREMMPVTVAGSAIQNIQGQVAGVAVSRQSGQPGADVTIMLRTPTFVDNPTPGGRDSRDTNPLIVVDGVILGNNTTNLESMDIESVEIIRGAAAASLYGSRAANGVIAITTTGGRGLEVGQTQFSARSELGITSALNGRSLPRHHVFAMNDAQTSYVDANGNPVGRSGRIPHNSNLALQFMDKPYPGPVYDNINAVFQPGAFQQHNITMAQNTESTNFAITLNRYREAGPLENNDGYDRSSFRINLDHRLRGSVSLGVRAFHSRDYRDETSLSFTDLYRAPPDVDLTVKDADGRYVQVPDPEISYENPLWVEGSRENERRRARTLASAQARWDPINWVGFSANLSYDRQDGKSRFWLPKDTPSLAGGEQGGRIEFESDLTDTWNAEAQVSFRQSFGPLNARTTFRGLLERARTEEVEASGREFIVAGVPRIDATPANFRQSTSYETEVRSDGYLWDTAFDYDGKYIATVLLRRDGSSLFGVDNRWHTYYRTAFAYRLGEEEWFNLPHVDEFKLAYARGTAGGRPPFGAQYEVWSLQGGQPRKSQLGNRDLRPEHTTEQEVSLDMIVAGRYGLTLTHAWQTTTDQLVTANLPGFTGYSSQWKNGGTVSGNTTEVTLEARLIQRPRFAWNSTAVFDYSRAKIDEWIFACENPAWRNYCTGNGLYEIWGSRFVDGMEALSRHLGGRAMERADEFMLNDDGLLVWVGPGNTWRDGIAKSLWGTSTQIGGTTFNWGMPFLEQAAAGGNVRTQIGDAAHANLGWVNNISFGALSFHGHLHAKIGGDLVNSIHQGMTIQNVAPDMDQSGKPDELKKPMLYYQTVYAGGGGSTYYVEDGSYIKLRTLSANYRLTPAQITRFGLGGIGIRTLELGLIGRNIMTITNFKAWDPEMGLNFAGGSQTAGNIYPPSRAYTASIAVTF